MTDFKKLQEEVTNKPGYLKGSRQNNQGGKNSNMTRPSEKKRKKKLNERGGE